MTAYQPHRSVRFEYAGDAIEHIEQHNCAKGCRVPSAASTAEFGPGGDCRILAAVFAEIEQAELQDDGDVITCTARRP